MSAFVEDQAARLLGIATESLDLDRPLMEMGLDSADLLKLQAQCEEKWQMVLQSGVFFEHNSLRKVIHYLSSQTAKTAPEPTRPPSAKTLPAGDGDDGKCVAVIGVSCKFPGGIETFRIYGVCWPTRSASSVPTLPREATGRARAIFPRSAEWLRRRRRCV